MANRTRELIGRAVVVGACLVGAEAARAQDLSQAVPQEVILLEPSPTPTVVPPAGGAGEAGPPCPCGVSGPASPDPRCDVDWSQVPPVFDLQRPGNFPIPPSGPGYFFFSDVLRGERRESPPRFPYGVIGLEPASFFNYDFRYLEASDNEQIDYADSYKRIKFGDGCWLFSTGGEVRYRYENYLNARLTGLNDNLDLFRTRVYGDLWYTDRARLFVEGIYAEAYNENLPALQRDETGVDLLNAFGELKLGELRDVPVYVRGGRQEMRFGSQRLVSSLEWANVRRTFQGVRSYRHGPKLDTDLFWVQPVVIDANDFDGVTGDTSFMGMWNTYKFRPGTAVDAYALNLSSQSRSPAGLNPGPGLAPALGDTVTLGGRFHGDLEQEWLWDFEAAGQFGERAGLDIGAAMATAGLGYHFKNLPWNPTVWAYYDYASGDDDPTDGEFGSFNPLFPFGHYYLGFLDLITRSNIQDVNFHLITNPAPWIVTLAQFHVFDLTSSRAPLFNFAGVPIASDPSGASGTEVGNELDLLVNFRLTPHQHLLLGYSKLFAGTFLTRQGVDRSPELFYVQYNYRW